MLMDALELDENRARRTCTFRNVDSERCLHRSAERGRVTRRRDSRDVLGNQRRELQADAFEPFFETSMLEKHRGMHADEILAGRLDHPARRLNDTGSDRAVKDRRDLVAQRAPHTLGVCFRRFHDRRLVTRAAEVDSIAVARLLFVPAARRHVLRKRTRPGRSDAFERFEPALSVDDVAGNRSVADAFAEKPEETSSIAHLERRKLRSFIGSQIRDHRLWSTSAIERSSKVHRGAGTTRPNPTTTTSASNMAYVAELPRSPTGSLAGGGPALVAWTQRAMPAKAMARSTTIAIAALHIPDANPPDRIISSLRSPAARKASDFEAAWLTACSRAPMIAIGAPNASPEATTPMCSMLEYANIRLTSRCCKRKNAATNSETSPTMKNSTCVNAPPTTAFVMPAKRRIAYSASESKAPESIALVGVGPAPWASGSQACIGAKPILVPKPMSAKMKARRMTSGSSRGAAAT